MMMTIGVRLLRPPNPTSLGPGHTHTQTESTRTDVEEMARLLFLLVALLPALAAAFMAPTPFRPTAAAGSRALIGEVRERAHTRIDRAAKRGPTTAWPAWAVDGRLLRP